MDNEFYTYVHIRLDTNKIFYVGKGKGNRYLSFSRRNNHWKNIVNKHGFEAKILCNGLSEKSSFETERSLIAILKSVGIPLSNMTNGGEGPSGMIHSESTKKKWSLAKIGKKRGSYTKDHCKKISDALKGRKVSDKTKEKISIATKIAMQSIDIKQKMRNAKLGKKRQKHSEATKLKMSISAKARWKTNETD